GLGDHRGDDPQELDGRVEVALLLEPEVYPQRADRFAVEYDGHANKGQLLVVQILPLGGPVQKQGLAADLWNYDGFAALDDAAGNAFAKAVTYAASAGRMSVCSFDGKVARLLIQQSDRAANHPVMALQDLEHAVECGLQVQRARKRLADLDQRRKLLYFSRLIARTGHSSLADT